MTAHSIRLERLLIKDFRCIKHLDVEIPENRRIICFVGLNGSGKSALTSLLMKDLIDMAVDKIPESSEEFSRHITGAEVRFGAKTYFSLRAWKIEGRKQIRGELVSRERLTVEEWGHLKEGEVPLLDDHDLRSARWSEKAAWCHTLTNVSPQEYLVKKQSLVDKSVFFIRPVDRFEEPGYQRKEEANSALSFAANWHKSRLFGYILKSWSNQLESFLGDLFFDKEYHDGHASSLKKILDIWNEFSDKDDEVLISPWPFRSVSFSRSGLIENLSTGELDLLTTAGHIVAQQLYLKHKFSLDYEPGGWVFIDEVDARFHPQAQQKIIPILSKYFPTINFCVTTHSPFVLRSLPKEESIVIRLPDGKVFTDDFSSWTADDILNVVFETDTGWSDEMNSKLLSLKNAAKDGNVERALSLYTDLSNRNTYLRTECDEIIALYATKEVKEAVRNI